VSRRWHCSDGEPEREQVGLPAAVGSVCESWPSGGSLSQLRAIFAGVNQAAAVADLRGAGVRVQRPAVEIAGLKPPLETMLWPMLKVKRLCNLVLAVAQRHSGLETPVFTLFAAPSADGEIGWLRAPPCRWRGLTLNHEPVPTMFQAAALRPANFNGWTLNADTSTTQVGNRSGLVHTGKYGAELDRLPRWASSRQTLPTAAGQTYLLSLWLTVPNNANGATPNEFQVQWEGATIYDAVNLPFTAWTNLQFTVTATASGSLLQFGFRDDPYYLGLDDISVKLVAVRTSARLRKARRLPFRLRRRAGELYQIQYKTNLMQADWVNLGAPISSETNALEFLDRDTANYPQKFYRLQPFPESPRRKNHVRQQTP